MEKVNEISERMWEVLGKTITLQTKAGRRIWTCSCQNHSRFCKENAYCSHKELVMKYIIRKPILKEVNNLINSYEGFRNIVKKADVNLILDDLSRLKLKLTK